MIGQHIEFSKAGGVFELNMGLIKVSGPDALDFLQRLTSQNIKKLGSGMGAQAALLQSNSAIISFFDIFNSGNYYLISVDADRLTQTFEFLERFHFAEDLKLENLTEDFKVLSVQGKTSGEALKKIFGKFPLSDHEVSGFEECFIARVSDFVGVGFHLIVKKERYEEVLKRFNGVLKTLDKNLWRLLRFESGRFEFNVDVTESNLVLETPLSTCVSRDKGCYPGQEVVERIFTYGNVSKKIVGIKWPGSDGKNISGHLKLFKEGAEVGSVTSAEYLPWSKQTVGFSSVRKPFYDSGQKLNLEDGTEVEVFSLPNQFEIKRELKSD